jgi:predicted esterase
VQGLWVLGNIVVLTLIGCQERDSPNTDAPSGQAAATASVASAPVPSQPDPGPVRVESMAVPGDQPAFVLRGKTADTPTVGVFLHGWCTHGMGLLQAFQFAAAETGKFIALQGDRHCGTGPMRAWSGTPVATDRRIDAALRAYLGTEPPAEILLGGSSQGADRVVELVRKFPGKYTRLVLMSGPHEISPSGLEQLRGAVLFVGEKEGDWAMKRTAERWQQAGISVRFHAIKDGGHSDLHGRGNPLMRDAFRFLRLLD